MKLIITGASDDLVEIDGDFSEEFSVPNSEGYIALSDGSLLFMKYINQWKAIVINRGTADIIINECELSGDSDQVIIDGDIKWIGLLEEFMHVK